MVTSNGHISGRHSSSISLVEPSGKYALLHRIRDLNVISRDLLIEKMKCQLVYALVCSILIQIKAFNYCINLLTAEMTSFLVPQTESTVTAQTAYIAVSTLLSDLIASVALFVSLGLLVYKQFCLLAMVPNPEC